VRVAFVHGFAGTPDAWADVRVDGVDATYIALTGHGDEPVRDTWAENIEVIAKRVGEVDAVVGYSLGARVALALVA
jgi:pimeloyl-ACP methyl ester carboxylesterase